MDTDQHHYLYPGTIHICRENCTVLTILGSCVAVCLWDAERRIGGMNHYMLPLWNGKGLASPKYGNIAIPRLYDKVVGMGARPSHLAAKVFGGASVLHAENNVFSIGTQNVRLAFDMLKELSIPVTNSSTGGYQGRKIIFTTTDGIVKMKFIRPDLIKTDGITII